MNYVKMTKREVVDALKEKTHELDEARNYMRLALNQLADIDEEECSDTTWDYVSNAVDLLES